MLTHYLNTAVQNCGFLKCKNLVNVSFTHFPLDLIKSISFQGSHINNLDPIYANCKKNFIKFNLNH